MIQVQIEIDIKSERRVRVNILAREDAAPDERELAHAIQDIIAVAFERAAELDGMGVTISDINEEE